MKAPQLKMRNGLPGKKSIRAFFAFYGIDGIGYLYHRNCLSMSWSGTQLDLIMKARIPEFEKLGFECEYQEARPEQLRRGWLRIQIKKENHNANSNNEK